MRIQWYKNKMNQINPDLTGSGFTTLILVDWSQRGSCLRYPRWSRSRSPELISPPCWNRSVCEVGPKLFLGADQSTMLKQVRIQGGAGAGLRCWSVHHAETGQYPRWSRSWSPELISPPCWNRSVCDTSVSRLAIGSSDRCGLPCNPCTICPRCLDSI